MKFLKVFFLAFCLSILLCSCGGNNNTPSSTIAPSPTSDTSKDMGTDMGADMGRAVRDIGNGAGEAVEDMGNAVGGGIKDLTR